MRYRATFEARYHWWWLRSPMPAWFSGRLDAVSTSSQAIRRLAW
jgi:hypothetical protein